MTSLLAAVAAAAVLALSGAASAQPAAPKGAAVKSDSEIAAVRKALEQKFPGAELGSVTKTPYFGLYEVQLDNRLVYTDAKARYLLVGAVYDTETKINLTDERQRKLNRVDTALLPLDWAIKKVKGTGERVMYVFSDADCPFCAKLEQELKGVDNVTIYTFLFPIDSLHPDAARKSRMIWCAEDRAQAWEAYYDTGALPNNSGDCDNPVSKTQELGAKYRVNATPTLLFADGSVVPGALPAQRIETELRNAEAEAKKLAAAKK
ncbi:MAG: DsbC family protein [Burkholderiales bacterium]|nr:DsbC family protein [Burkholderiales bacterium]